MMKYYYKSYDGNTITYLCKSDNVPETCTELTKEQYDNYKATLNSIEDRDGYKTIVTLHVDGTYDVEYIQENVVHEVVEEPQE